MPASTKPRISARLAPKKMLLFSGATIFLFFALLEGVLALVGVKPVIVREDPYVGFASYQKLYRPAASGDDLETARNKLALFNAQRFSRRKRPGVLRIFTVGGSTTYGRPFDDATSFSGWLRTYLSTLGGHEWEVINAGGISYASYRVATVMEELVQYEPDLFIIYSGNNEFLEKRTYGELIDEPVALTRTRGLLQRSRLWALGRVVVESRRAGARRRYELTGEVRELLDSSAGLELYERDDAFERQVLEHYAFNLQRMVDLAQAHGARVILVTIPVNEKDFAPFKSQHRDGMTAEATERYTGLLTRARAQLERGQADQARLLAEEATALDPRFADGQYVLGRTLLAAGRHEEARQALTRAIEEDICPLRALPAINRTIAETAERNGIGLVDFRELVRARTLERTGSDIPGDELFLDHVHPTLEANGILARALLEQIGETGMPMLAGDLGRVDAAVRAEVLARVDAAARARADKNLAKVLIWAGKKQEAEKYVRRAEAMLPDDWEVQYNAGQIQADAGAHNRAIEHLREASRLNPSRAEPYDRLGSVYARIGEIGRAIEVGRQATTIDPGMAGAWNNLGTYYQATGELDLSLEVTERAIALDPGFAEAQNNLGNIYFDMGRTNEALRSYDRAIALRPRYAAAMVGRGLVLGQLGRLDDATQTFSEALRLDRRLPAAHVGRGKVLLARGDLPGAILAFGQAIDSDARHVEGFEMLASSLAMDSRTDEALRILERGIRHNPESARLHLLEGRLLAQALRYDGAARAFNQAIELDPQLLEPKIDLGALHVAAGRYDEAIDSCRRFLESNPASDALHHVLANALLLLNRVEEAQSHLKQALTLNPGNALAASDLAAVHEHFGRLDEALELYRAAARIDPSLEAARESALRVRERLARR